jgi:amino-acid N-acetyltransferase
MHIYRNPPESQVKHLLAESKLPTSDLSPQHLEHFFGCGPVEKPKGVVGLEIYGTVALLRSLAVSADSRGNGYGKALVGQIERFAQSQGITDVYLLTTTAAEFFERLGYRRTDRESAPEAIRQTEEFSTLCPSTSTFMVKVLPANPALHPTREARG